jgi:hypothetical protein
MPIQSFFSGKGKNPIHSRAYKIQFSNTTCCIQKKFFLNNGINFIQKFILGTITGLVRPGNTPTWAVDFYLKKSSASINGLALLSHKKVCINGFKFVYSDGSSRTVGNGNEMSSILNIEKSNSLSIVKSFGGWIIDFMQICNSVSCEEEGNIYKNDTNTNVTVEKTWNITHFWGSFANFGDQTCVENFGIYYN